MAEYVFTASGGALGGGSAIKGCYFTDSFGAALNGNWLIDKPQAGDTAATSGGVLVLAAGTSSTWYSGADHQCPLVYCAAPEGDFCCTIKITAFTGSTGNRAAGLMLYNDRNNAVCIFDWYDSQSMYAIISDAANDPHTNAWPYMADRTVFPMYHRIRKVGTSIFYEASKDNVSWWLIHQDTTAGDIGTPLYIGVFCRTWFGSTASISFDDFTLTDVQPDYYTYEAFSDAFDDASIDSHWMQQNNNLGSISEASGSLQVSGASLDHWVSSKRGPFIVRRVPPTTPWAIWGKWKDFPSATNSHAQGLCVYKDVANFYTIDRQCESGQTIRVHKFVGNGNTQLFSEANSDTYGWFKIEYNGTYLKFYHKKEDVDSWTLKYTEATAAIVPLFFGMRVKSWTGTTLTWYYESIANGESSVTVGAGGALAGGAATVEFVVNSTQEKIVTMDGGAVAGADAPYSFVGVQVYTTVMTGGGVAGDGATIFLVPVQDVSVTMAGGAVAGGTLGLLWSSSYTGAGGAVAGGTPGYKWGRAYSGAGGGIGGGDSHYLMYHAALPMVRKHWHKRDACNDNVWDFIPQGDKPHYNEGDEISNAGGPWRMDKPAFGGTPITPIHDPWCGYWTKGPGLPGYNGRLYTFTNTGGASRAYGYRINVDDMSFVLTKLWDATAITTFPSNYGRMKYADYFGRIYIVGYSGNRPHVYEMDIDNLNILAKRIVGTVVEGTDGLKYCAINDWTMQDLNRPITGWGYTSYWSTLDADVTSYILSPWVGDAAFRSINGLDVQTEYYNGSFYTMRNNTAYGPAVKSNRESGAISGSLGDDILAYPQVYNDKLWAMKERGFGSWFCEYDLNLTWVRETALPNSGGYTCFPCMFDNHAYFTSSVWPTAGDKSIIRLDLGDFSTVSYHDALYNTWSSVKVASDGKLYATGSGGWGRFDSGTLALEAVYSSYGSPYGIEIGFDSAGREYAFGVWQHADLSWRIVKIGPLPSLTFAGMTPALTGVPYNKILYIDP